MVRNLAELKAECEKNGVSIPMGAGKKEIENALRDFYWTKENPGEAMPEQVAPMLAEKFKDLETDQQMAVWDSKFWVAQKKLDGCRLLMHILPDGNRFTTRGKSVRDFMYGEKTDNLPFHRDLKLPDLIGTILDGEILSPYAQVKTGSVVTTSALQAVAAVINSDPELGVKIQNEYGPMEFHAFDILRFRGKDVTKEPYELRLKYLASAMESVMAACGDKGFKQVPIVTEEKEDFFRTVVKDGGEGIMLKDLRAPYYEGKRSGALLKVKRFEEYDAYAVGFVPGEVGKEWEQYVGGLLFAVKDRSGKERIIGCVSAMTDEFRRSITVPGEAIAVPSDGEIWPGGSTRSFGEAVRRVEYRLNPEVVNKVATIQGQEFTGRNFRLKHCVFSNAYTKGGKFIPWREDKRADDCVEDIEAIVAKIAQGERA